MMEYWNDGKASFGRINACGGGLDNSSQEMLLSHHSNIPLFHIGPPCHGDPGRRGQSNFITVIIIIVSVIGILYFGIRAISENSKKEAGNPCKSFSLVYRWI